MKTYYVLWMPTMAEMRPPYFCRRRVSHKLEDSKNLGGYYLKGEIDDSLDIAIEYERTGIVGCFRRLFRKKSSKVIFHMESHILSRGFVQYSCELPETELDEIQKGLVGKMRSPLYHFVKEFYHSHTHHHASQDSLLQAYISDSLIDVNARYEDISLFYILQYRDLLVDFNEVTQTQICITKARINRTHKVQRSIATLGDIIKAGNDLNGQLNYMDYLLNRLARSYSVPKNLRSEIVLLRKNTQLILSDALTSYNVSTAALGVKYGIQGIRWGIGGIIVSCTIFALSAYLSSIDYSTENKIEDVQKDIIRKDSIIFSSKTDSIRRDIIKVEQHLKKLEKAVKKGKTKHSDSEN